MLEILLVVGIIAILAGIVIIAINPARQLAQTRNTQRLSDIKQINNALIQYYIDNNEYPANASTTALVEICDTGAASSTEHGLPCTGLTDLSILVPTYVVSMPVDPQGELAFFDKLITRVFATDGGTGYKGMIENDKVVLTSPNAELGEVIAIGTTTVATGGEEEPPVVPCGDPTNPDCWSADDITNGPVIWGPTGVIGTSGDTDGSVSQATWFNVVGNSASYPAFHACYNLEEGGHTDWYLPSVDELTAAYGVSVPGFQSGYYWSSTEYSGSPEGIAWLFSMGNGDAGYDGKGSPHDLVRCLR